MNNYICTKTGRSFSSKRGLTNHLRSIYKDSSTEEIYLLETGKSKPKCVYCGSDCAFISIFKGYYNRCDSKTCCKKSQENGYIKRDSSLFGGKEYVEYVKCNVDFYSNIYLRNLFPAVDPYDGKIIKCRKTLARKISIEAINDMPLDEYSCLNCDTPIFLSKFATACTAYCSLYCGKSFGQVKRPVREKRNRPQKEIKYYEYNNTGKTCRLALYRRKYIIAHESRIQVARELFHNLYSCSNCSKQFSPGLDSHKLIVDSVDHENKTINIKLEIKYSCRENLTFCGAECYHNFRTKSDIYDASEKTRKLLSEGVKNRIANGEWTPAVTNSWTRRKIKYDSISFRSSWELLYHLISKHEKFEAQYEVVRIPYINLDGESSIYIVDFVLPESRTLIEIKPSALKDIGNNLLKSTAAVKYAEQNDMKYVIIDNEYFTSKSDYIKTLLEMDEFSVYKKLWSQFIT